MLALLALSALAAPLVLAQRGATVDRYDYSNNYVYASASDYDDCEYTSYYVNGNVYDDDTRVVSIEVSYNTYCSDYAYYYACVNLNVPDEATWVRDGNRVTITASGTLADCGYYSYGGNGARCMPEARDDACDGRPRVQMPRTCFFVVPFRRASAYAAPAPPVLAQCAHGGDCTCVTIFSRRNASVELATACCSR